MPAARGSAKRAPLRIDANGVKDISPGQRPGANDAIKPMQPCKGDTWLCRPYRAYHRAALLNQGVALVYYVSRLWRVGGTLSIRLKRDTCVTF